MKVAIQYTFTAVLTMSLLGTSAFAEGQTVNFSSTKKSSVELENERSEKRADAMINQAAEMASVGGVVGCGVGFVIARRGAGCVSMGAASAVLSGAVGMGIGAASAEEAPNELEMRSEDLSTMQDARDLDQ